MHLIVPKTWGHEKIIANNAALIDGYGYCLKELTVNPNGNACSIHYHAIKTETFYILRGALMLEIYTALGERNRIVTDPSRHLEALVLCGLYRMHPGESMTINPGEPHRFWAEQRLNGGEPLEHTVFMEGSTPDNPNDSYRIVPAGPTPNTYREIDVIEQQHKDVP